MRKKFQRIKGTKVTHNFIVQERSLEEVERDHIIAIYNYCRFNATRACSILQISRAKLYRKLEIYALQDHIQWLKEEK